MKHGHALSAFLAVMTAISVLIPLARADSVLCRGDFISGLENLGAWAVVLMGAPTTNLSAAKVFVSAKKGELYVHTNYTESLGVHPAKLVTDDAGTTLDEAIARIIYSDEANVNIPLLRKTLMLYVDKESIEKNNYRLNYSDYDHVKIVSTKVSSEFANPDQSSQPSFQKVYPVELAPTDRPSETSAYVAKNSTKGTCLFAIEGVWSGSVVLCFPTARVSMTLDELKTLNTGRALPSSHSVTKELNADVGSVLLMCMPRDVTGNTRTAILSSEVSDGIQRSYPRCRVARSLAPNPSPTTVDSLKAKTISGPGDVVTVIDDASFDAARQNDILEIGSALAIHGFSSVVTFRKGITARYNYGTDRVIIVVTGRTGADLSKFLASLQDAGAFNGNFVVMNSCNEPPGDSVLATILLGKGGAKAVFAQRGPVQAAPLRESLIGLTKALKDGQAHSLWDVIVRTFQMHNLNGVWLV